MESSKMKVILIALASFAFSVAVADARGYSYGGHHSRGTYGFATSSCKRSSCFAKHPSGHFVHPLTYRRHR
jgi:hypothetical protein